MKANETPKPADPYLLPQLEATLGRGLFNIVLGSTCLALGCMAAALQALRRGPSGFTFRLSAGTFVAFGVGLAAGCLYWKLTSRSLVASRLAGTILLLIGVGAFLYPLRFVRTDKMSEIAIGLATATCALSTVALLLLKLKRFFDKDEETVEMKKLQ
jgi:hypothetical protein